MASPIPVVKRNAPVISSPARLTKLSFNILPRNKGLEQGQVSGVGKADLDEVIAYPGNQRPGVRQCDPLQRCLTRDS